MSGIETCLYKAGVQEISLCWFMLQYNGTELASLQPCSKTLSSLFQIIAFN